MTVLYIDTSSSYLYAGIVKDSNLVSEIKEELGHNLSEVALPKIAEMFEKSSILPNQVDKIIVVNGPGSFTGIRVGLTIAKVYAWSLNIPITTITSLEAMSVGINERVVVPLIDALKDNCYAAIYEDGKEVLKPQHISLDKLKEILNNYRDYIIVTNDSIDLNFKKCNYDPQIETIVNKFCSKENINPHYVNPEYLKLSAAEEAKNDN